MSVLNGKGGQMVEGQETGSEADLYDEESTMISIPGFPAACQPIAACHFASESPGSPRWPAVGRWVAISGADLIAWRGRRLPTSS